MPSGIFGLDRPDHPAELIGAPVSLQVVGQRLEEEKTLAVARLIAKALQ